MNDIKPPVKTYIVGAKMNPRNTQKRAQYINNLRHALHAKNLRRVRYWTNEIRKNSFRAKEIWKNA